ncbi:SpdA protein OS=Streptomyces viridochromogenes OX=1938 GN=ACM01_28070 PE=4 SV=1 [Streptomyces viridochromogenes]
MRAHLARVDAVIVQAVIAGALSFSHLHDVAAAAGQDGWKAWAYPVSVDLLLVAAWRRMRQSQRAGQAAGGPRLWFLVALAASLGANVATAGLLDLDDVPAWLRVTVAGWPAVAFFGGTLLAHAPHIPERPAAFPATHAPTAPDGGSSDAEGPDLKVPFPADPEPASKHAAARATAPAPAPAPAVALPPALVDRVRALADEHRSATGHPADPDAVRTRLGLPPSMTASVAAHL